MKSAAWLFSMVLTIAPAMVHAETRSEEAAGTVGNLSGTLVVQRVDGTINVVAPKAEMFAGDMLITGKDSYAQVTLRDGTRMTIRPNSNLRIQAYHFHRDAPGDDNIFLRLLRGGFRTVTGLIGKRGNLDAYKLQAATATIGVRGTDFSTRLCATRDCKDDNSAPAPQLSDARVIGRVMRIEGTFSALDMTGNTRPLQLAGPVYEGDTLITGERSYAVVAFRDEGRVTLQASTRFRVEKFKYDKAKSEESAIVRLLKGGVRVVSGLIGHFHHDDYKFNLATATIGIRGTGFDAWCNGACANGSGDPGATQGNPLDGAGVYVWSGEVVLVSPGGSFDVALQQAAILARDSGKPVRVLVIPPAITGNGAPRPDSIPLDMNKLFGSDADAGSPGLYVTVHEGHVVLSMDDKTLDLFRGETGYSDSQLLKLLSNTPGFMSDTMEVILKDSQGAACMIGAS